MSLFSCLFDLGGFAGAAPEVVQFRAPYLTLAGDLDVVDLGGVERESPLYAYAERKTANGKRFADTAVFLGDDGAFESLKPLAVAFDDFDENFDVVADVESGQVGSETFFFKCVDNVHDLYLL